MKKVLLGTTNEGKLTEARSLLGVEVEGVSLDVPEIQDMNPESVAIAKAKAYFENVGKPVLVEDISLDFDALNGLPGVYINDFSGKLGNQGLIDLLEGKESRAAIARVVYAYALSPEDIKTFIGEVKGNISDEIRGDNGFGWDPIFVPEGSEKTFAEMELVEKNKYSMRRIALEKFKEFLLDL